MDKKDGTGVKPASDSVNKVEVRDKAIRLFVGAVADMSWQLAIVVLGPIIGGYYLDKAVKTSPIFLLLGILLAMLGFYAVLKRMLNVYGQKSVTAPRERK